MVSSGVSPFTTTSSNVMLSAFNVMVPRLPAGLAMSWLS